MEYCNVSYEGVVSLITTITARELNLSQPLTTLTAFISGITPLCRASCVTSLTPGLQSSRYTRLRPFSHYPPLLASHWEVRPAIETKKTKKNGLGFWDGWNLIVLTLLYPDRVLYVWRSLIFERIEKWRTLTTKTRHCSRVQNPAAQRTQAKHRSPNPRAIAAVQIKPLQQILTQ